MITLNGIHDAVHREIAAVWPALDVYHDVLPKNFTRPSFYVALREFGPVPENGTTTAVCLRASFTVAAFEIVDEYHNSQVFSLNNKLMRLAGIFGRGFLTVGERAVHLTAGGGKIVATDAAELVLTAEWWEDLSDFAHIPEADVPLLKDVEIAQE